MNKNVYLCTRFESVEVEKKSGCPVHLAEETRLIIKI